MRYAQGWEQVCWERDSADVLWRETWPLEFYTKAKAELPLAVGEHSTLPPIKKNSKQLWEFFL